MGTDPLHALTIWQPWATLIVEGAKPYEFRHWSAPRWIVGRRIAIHAGARKMRLAEVRALQIKLTSDVAATGLIAEIARPILERCRRQLEAAGRAEDEGQLALRAELGVEIPAPLPLASVLGTAILGAPTKNPVVAGRHLAEDSDRTAHMNWAWPLGEVERFDIPLPAKGAQGFWRWERADA